MEYWSGGVLVEKIYLAFGSSGIPTFIDDRPAKVTGESSRNPKSELPHLQTEFNIHIGSITPVLHHSITPFFCLFILWPLTTP
jgi:hypothetical protein